MCLSFYSHLAGAPQRALLEQWKTTNGAGIINRFISFQTIRKQTAIVDKSPGDTFKNVLPTSPHLVQCWRSGEIGSTCIQHCILICRKPKSTKTANLSQDVLFHNSKVLSNNTNFKTFKTFKTKSSRLKHVEGRCQLISLRLYNWKNT